jgi:peptide-methionine (S)-S-oxide reductase
MKDLLQICAIDQICSRFRVMPVCYSGDMSTDTKSIVLGSGCFWCIEAFLQLFRGVIDVTPGYAGGTSVDPTYEQVCYGIGGYAEVVQVTYNPSLISLPTLLEVFWAIHDPTTRDRQGHDVGKAYRSCIYYSDKEDRVVIDTALIAAQANWPDRIVTEIRQLDVFYEAEKYHKNYFRNNPEKAYCQIVINPKLKTIRAKFADLMV